MSSVIQPRQPVEPVHGTVRWLHRFYDGIGAIEISGVPYAVAQVEGGYRLARNDEGGEVIFYDVETHWQCWECSCPDWLWRYSRQDDPNGGGCKHVRALRAALAEDRGLRLYRPEE